MSCPLDRTTLDCGCYPPTSPAIEAPAPAPLTENNVDPPMLRPVPGDEPSFIKQAPPPTFLPPTQSPVVELAPDFVLPPEPPTAPLPRNSIPRPGELLPRNVIPQQAD